MVRKHFAKLFITCFFIFVFFQHSQLFANENTITIRVGYIPNDDLISDINKVGYEGYGYEIFRKVEEISDFQFEFIKIEDDIFKALDNNIIDVAGLYFFTPERAQNYHYLSMPLNAVQTALIAPTEKNRVYDSPKDIDGKTVASYEGNIANIFLDEYAKKHNISVNYIIGHINNYKTIEADYYLAYSSDSDLDNYNNVLNFEKRNTFLISSPEKKPIMDKLDSAIYEIITTEGNFFELLNEKYTSETFHTFHRSLREKELQVLRNKTFKVAYNEIANPFTYTNTDGAPAGVLIDIMNRLVEIYEFDIEYYPYSHSNPTAVLENCDIVLSVVGDMSYYSKHFTPSESFLNLPIIAMVHRDKIEGKANSINIINSSPKIGSMEYLHTNFDSFLQVASDNSFIFFKNIKELLEAYKNEDIDMAIMSQLSLAYANSFLGKNDSFTYSADFDLKISLNIAKDIADEYIPIFNIMLDNISEREYQEILTQNEANHFYEQSFRDLLIENWLNLALFVFVILSIVLYLALSSQRRRRKDIQHAYNTDSLTSFMTLNKFSAESKKRASAAQSNTYEIISFDIDMFKSINMHYGEEQGTLVILTIAYALNKAFINFNDVLLCRKTGDQFLIFRRIDQGGTIQAICYKHIIPSIKHVMGDNYNLSLSFGQVTICDNQESASLYLAKAENARMRGKDDHKTTFIVFDDDMKKYYENKLNVTHRMKDALKNREFSVVYQPKIDFSTLQVGGAEALVRWYPHEGETIYPDEFIPIFEQNGFILSLDLYVLENVCRFILENPSLKMPRISVNLSAHSILADRLIQRITEIIRVHGIEPEKIEFEMTESAVETDPVLFLQRIQELKECGFYVSIDDFGAGVSSLNRLSSIDAQVLKLDKAFFGINGTEEKNKLVVSNVVKMAKDLKMMVVAEGVETKEQALWLRALNSDYAQGYYFAKPMHEDDFKTLLESDKVFLLD